MDPSWFGEPPAWSPCGPVHSAVRTIDTVPNTRASKLKWPSFFDAPSDSDGTVMTLHTCWL